ncbi:hypothetical protein CHCC14596_3776 [Bacillus licheniformis]|nr:hypothetical protein CHCC14596_3776 [Bacillus licheniformis]
MLPHAIFFLKGFLCERLLFMLSPLFSFENKILNGLKCLLIRLVFHCHHSFSQSLTG